MTNDDVPVRPEDFQPGTRNVSNSEVTTWLNCRRMYHFNYVDALAPRVTSDPLQRGIDGHGAFERYVDARLQGYDHAAAFQIGLTYFEDAIRQGRDIGKAMEIQHIWERYMNAKAGFPEWRFLGAEERQDFNLTDSLNIAIRYDVFVEELSSSKYLLVDWKFTYDFWSDKDHYLNGQMPKYIAVMRLNNIRVDGGIVEEIRTRRITAPDKLNNPDKNLWRRSYYYPLAPKIRNMIKQHVSAALEIESYRGLSPVDQVEAAIPVLNKHGACKFCDYTSLCNSMNEGIQDLSVDKRVNYVTNEYVTGYNPESSVEKPDPFKELM